LSTRERIDEALERGKKATQGHVARTKQHAKDAIKKRI